MTVEPGHFYMDSDGDIWQATGRDEVTFAAHGDGHPDVIPGDTHSAGLTDLWWGPLREVRPVVWVEVF